ncbi:Trp biosynthesis-associated membrane protein [Herbiconiux moechotypicola]|uniref:Trp biosynthesis-associated membrane protein n=1 Tax=Herbiconiux moechotypicola TaxID=637393 RepID=A0ABN3D6A7_9MICO|nr:Trp biosynthesis-associated membrane protein [Herbiconiux moechotypicola]MCS5728638.1 Trp biosynthesis-associated membrane protein [Herbiconiux moechotypicola]
MSRPAAPVSSGRRIKLFSILGVLLLSALTFLAWSQSWGSLVLVAGSSGETTLDVPGSVAAPALSALGLAGLALAGALAIAGPVVRLVLGALEVLLGVSVLWSALGALLDPVGAGASVVTTSTGVAGEESIRGLVTVGAESAWPLVAVVLGAGMIVAGVVVIVTVRRWPASGRKYQAVRFESADGRQSADPSELFDDETEGTGADAESVQRAAPVDAAARRDAAVDDWDELTRGSDPTR